MIKIMNGLPGHDNFDECGPEFSKYKWWMHGERFLEKDINLEDWLFSWANAKVKDEFDNVVATIWANFKVQEIGNNILITYDEYSYPFSDKDTYERVYTPYKKEE